MIHTLENSAVHLEVNPGLARWSVSGKQRNSPSLENIEINLSYRRGFTRRNLLNRWSETKITEQKTYPSPHGPLRQLGIDIASPKDALHCKLFFAVPDNHPLLLWKLSVENRGSHAVNIDKIELLTLGYI